jgi:hypothetical protein
MAHKQMVQRLLQVRAHLILCFRAEQKVEMVRNQAGKMEIQPKRIASGFSDWIPICEKNILYELTASFLLTPDKPGVPLPIKLQEQHRAFFPSGEPISEKAGQALSEWAAGTTRDPKADSLASLEKARGSLGFPDPEWNALLSAKLNTTIPDLVDVALLDEFLAFLRKLAKKDPAALAEASGIVRGDRR